MAISKKVAERIVTQIKRYQQILAEAKDRDISESDTVIIIADMLADVLGYKKFTEITTEYSIRGTFVDLAVKVNQELRFFIEAKAIGASLKDAHIKQAIDYGANQGLEWVILSNGVIWQIYKIIFRQPIEKILIYEFNILNFTPRNNEAIECLYNLTREGFTKSSMAAFGQQQQILSRFSLAAILLSPSMLHALKKEIRTYSSTIKVEEENLKDLLQAEVFKREVVDSEDAKKALEFLKKTIKSTTKPALKKKPDAIKKEATEKTDNVPQPVAGNNPENNIVLPQPPAGSEK